MRPGMPGSNDRLIGRHDQGGYGGGRVICPIFDSRVPDLKSKVKIYSNFHYIDTSEGVIVTEPPEVTPHDAELGTIRVLFVPGLLHYSLETHYKTNKADWESENWIRLVKRLGVDPLNAQAVHSALKQVLIPVLLQSGGVTPNPREHFIEVRTTMASQAVPFESIGQIVPHLGRLGDKRKNLRQVRILQARTKRPLKQRLENR
jgi:hypothetical protein